MTNPGDDAGQTGSSDSGGGESEPTSSGYEAPPIEQANSGPITPVASNRSSLRRSSNRRRRSNLLATRPRRVSTHRISDPAALSATDTALHRDPPPPTTAPGGSRYPDYGGFSPPGPPGYGPPSYADPPRVRRAAVSASSPYGVPPPGYGPPPPATPGIRRWFGPPGQKTNGLAIASLVASMVGICSSPLTVGSVRSSASCSASSRCIRSRDGRGWSGARNRGHRRRRVVRLSASLGHPMMNLRSRTGSNPEQPSSRSAVSSTRRWRTHHGARSARAVDYPADAGFPPPIYGRHRVPRRRAGLLPGVRPVPADQAAGHQRQSDRLTRGVDGGVACCGPRRSSGSFSAYRDPRDPRTGQHGHGLALAGTIIGGLAPPAG